VDFDSLEDFDGVVGFDSLEDVEDVVGFDSLEVDVADSLFEPEPSELEVLEPFDDEAVELDERESVMYQPLPLNTMPTGWITLRSAPPHCSQVVSGGSEKLWRFSITSLQAVQV